MKTKKLNLEEAFHLASVLAKYVNVEEITYDLDAVEFIGSVIGKLTPQEYLECVILLTEENVDTIEKEISLDILASFVEGLRDNHIIALIAFYKSLGLT